MKSIDFAGAYYTISVLCMGQKYLFFQFKGNLYKHKCFPNGLPLITKMLSKILKPVFSAFKKEGYQIVGYLDDNFLMGDTFNECKNPILPGMKLI